MELVASKCASCEHVILPPRKICPYCGPDSPDQMEVHLAPMGEVLSFTSLQRPPVGFNPPVVLALIRLEEGPTILSLGSKEELERTEIGSKVKLSIDSHGRYIHSLN